MAKTEKSELVAALNERLAGYPSGEIVRILTRGFLRAEAITGKSMKTDLKIIPYRKIDSVLFKGECFDTPSIPITVIDDICTVREKEMTAAQMKVILDKMRTFEEFDGLRKKDRDFVKSNCKEGRCILLEGAVLMVTGTPDTSAANPMFWKIETINPMWRMKEPLKISWEAMVGKVEFLSREEVTRRLTEKKDERIAKLREEISKLEKECAELEESVSSAIAKMTD